MSCEVISDQPLTAFTTFHLRLICSEFLKRSVPSGTVRTWRNRIGLKADGGYYSKEDVQYLLDYLSAKSQGLTTAQFLEKKWSS